MANASSVITKPVVGLDLSLTSTGVACDTGSYTIRFPAERGMARLVAIREAVLVACAHAHLVAVEGYSFSSRSSQAHALGELGGVVRVALWEAHIPFVDVPPASLKKYATGKGNASKELMLVAAVRRLRYAGSSNDEADALWLRAMACDAYGQPVVHMPAAHREALRAIAWPWEEVA